MRTAFPRPRLQEARAPRSAPASACGHDVPPLSPGTGRRLLQALITPLVRTIGRPVEAVPPHVHRAFYRGAVLVLTSGSDRRIQWVWKDEEAC